MADIDIRGLSKAKVLAALYNCARPQGMGFLHYDPKPMTEEEAEEFLGIGDDLAQGFGSYDRNPLYFDYLKGRVMKVDLSGDTINPVLYDRDNGEGSAVFAIEYLRETGEVVSLTGQEQHERNKVEAAAEVMDHIGERTTVEDGAVRLGPGDHAPELRSAITKALEEPEEQN